MSILKGCEEVPNTVGIPGGFDRFASLGAGVRAVSQRAPLYATPKGQQGPLEGFSDAQLPGELGP